MGRQSGDWSAAPFMIRTCQKQHVARGRCDSERGIGSPSPSHDPSSRLVWPLSGIPSLSGEVAHAQRLVVGETRAGGPRPGPSAGEATSEGGGNEPRLHVFSEPGSVRAPLCFPVFNKYNNNNTCMFIYLSKSCERKADACGLYCYLLITWMRTWFSGDLEVIATLI
jgi:hypothetical protein